ncbi:MULTISPECIES: hypothetical protein [unclassified Nocardioides]|jgi:hypothetical protein|uniref:hypothetical protein n=1 Tax=Nocardioides sp. URHA0032 TaxID=1380388 RepID=UPI00048A887E|nr:hypothetical protein [Nocardioides sp. URHA0032]
MGPETVDRIMDLLDEIDEKIQWVTDKVNDILSWVPWGLGWVVDKFKDLWNKAMEKLGEFWDKVGEIASNIGAPWDLDSAKDAWIEVGGPVAARASESDRSQSAVDTEWKGRAADRYALSLGPQGKALSAVQSKLTAQIGPALGAVASALYVFYVLTAAALAALVVAIIAAGGETVSIIGLPAVPATILGAVVVAIAALASAVINLRAAASGANSTFLQVANETGDFGAENWPSAVIG